MCTHSRCDVDEMLRHRLVSILKSDYSSRSLVTSVLDEHCMCRCHNHRTIFAIVTWVERYAEHKAVGLYRVVIDSTLVPWCVHCLCICFRETSGEQKKLNYIFIRFSMMWQSYGSKESSEWAMWSFHRSKPERVAIKDVLTPNIW